MHRLRRIRYRISGAAALIGVSMLVAACGSSNSATTSAPVASGAGGSTASSTATATPASVKGVAISTAGGSGGSHLTGASGKTVYLWVADSGGKSSCAGACAKVWPPLTTTGKPIAGSGVQSSDLGTIKRSDGSTQVTYKGHPLYYFIEDKGKGSIKGQGSDGFGAKWWLVSPAGTAITSGGAPASTGAGASSSTTSSSSGSSGGGSSSWG